MTLPIDSSRALRTLDELLALVTAIRDAPSSEPETDSIEWKSSWDLNKPSMCFETAKHVLGFGNRPVAASKDFEGCAYFLAGVEPSNLCGTSVVDPATISDKLGRYIESGKPRWSPQYVSIEGSDVLVITVEASQQGSSICTLQKGFNQIPSGRIFIRKHGKTEEAGPADVRELEARSRAGRPQVELHVTRPSDSPLPVLAPQSNAFDIWLRAERERLALPAPPTPQFEKIFNLPPPPISLSADPRSRERYNEEVDEYLKHADRRWKAGWTEAVINDRVAALELQIENPTERNYTGVQVTLAIPTGPTVWHDTEEVKSFLDAPTPPKPWGKMRRLEPSASAIVRSFQTGTSFRSSVEIERSRETTTVRFDPEHVRPLAKVALPALHLVLLEDPGDIEITWQLTSSSVDGQVSGVITCPVSDMPNILQFGDAEAS